MILFVCPSLKITIRSCLVEVNKIKHLWFAYVAQTNYNTNNNIDKFNLQHFGFVVVSQYFRIWCSLQGQQNCLYNKVSIPCSCLLLSIVWQAVRHSWSSGDGINPAEPPAVSWRACHQWWSSLLIICAWREKENTHIVYQQSQENILSRSKLLAKYRRCGMRCQLERTGLDRRPADCNRIVYARTPVGPKRRKKNRSTNVNQHNI